MKKVLFSLFILACAVLGATEYRSQVYLNGVWEYAFSKTPELAANAEWRQNRVPSSWGSSRSYEFNFNNYRNEHYGFFKTGVNVPADWQGKYLKLVFEFISIGHEIKWNGKVVASGTESDFWKEIVLSPDMIRYGETNELVVRTSGGKDARFAGIPRNVLLYALPEVSVRYAHVLPSVREKKLAVRTTVENFTGKDAEVEVRSCVLDNGKTVLTLPVQKAVISKEGELNSSAAWENPVLWGYGKYGKPYLYFLKTELVVNGKVVDVKYDRFGFREFYAVKDKFYFNGKEFYIKGDVATVTTRHNEYVPAATVYYQYLREVGFNLLRLHTDENFDPSEWFTAADELGFLVETETWRFNIKSDDNGKIITKSMLANEPQVKAWWRNYVNANFNHPSIIFWCVDNESFSVGETSVENLRKINPEKMRSYDELIQTIRKHDPTRIVEINHNLSLYPFVKQGKFSKESFQVYNYHPYGNLTHSINNEIKIQGFKGEVPILIGEIFGFMKKVDWERSPRSLFAEQKRTAKSLYDQIHQAAVCKHVSGVITCGQSGDGRFGFNKTGKFLYGPWNEFAREMKDGKEVGIYTFKIIPKFPSLSGPGLKVSETYGWRYYGGWFLCNVNWFDPTVPKYHLNFTDEAVQKALFEITGDRPEPLPDTRKPEIVAVVGKENAGKMVFLKDPNRSGYLDGVVADPNGTAWFRLPGVGSYQVVCGNETRSITIDKEPALTMKAGYDYLTWLDFNGNESEKMKAALNTPVERYITNMTTKEEQLKNSDVEYWRNGTPTEWIINDKVELSEDAHSGKYSAKITQGGALIQIIALEKGKNYRISCYAKRIKGKGVPAIQICNWSCNPISTTPGEDVDGKWQRVSVDFTFTGSERYIYFRSQKTEPGAEFLYDTLSIKEVNSAKGREPLKAGPFKLDKDGYVLHFLSAGPFSNRGDSVSGYEAGKTDYLKNYGGEAAYKAVYNKKLETVFGDDSYWIPGKYEIRWEQLHLAKCNEDIRIQLADAEIKGDPAANNVAAYLYCELHSPVEKKVQFGLNSDDAYVLYINGEKVGEFLGNRGATPGVDMEKYTVTLKKGKNILMAKSIQEGGGWTFLCRILEMNGMPCKDVTITLPGAVNILKNVEFKDGRNSKGATPWTFSNGFKFRKWSGKNAVCIPGSQGQGTCVVNVKPGAKYRVSGWVYSPVAWAGDGLTASIGVRTMDYKWLVHLKANNTVGEWQFLEGICSIPENVKSVYFYLMNYYIRKDDVRWYSQPCMELIEDEQ